MNDAKKEAEMVSMVTKKMFETLANSLEKLSRVQEASGTEGVPIDDRTTNGIHINSLILAFWLSYSQIKKKHA